MAIAIASLSYCMAPFRLSICNCGKDYSLESLCWIATPCCCARRLEAKEQSSEGVQCIFEPQSNPTQPTFGKLVKILPPPFGQTLIKLPPIGLTPIRLPPFENLYRFLVSAMNHSKRTFLELGRAICIQDSSQVSFEEILTRFVQGWNGKWNYLHFRQPLEVLWDALKKTFRFGGNWSR